MCKVTPLTGATEPEEATEATKGGTARKEQLLKDKTTEPEQEEATEGATKGGTAMKEQLKEKKTQEKTVQQMKATPPKKKKAPPKKNYIEEKEQAITRSSPPQALEVGGCTIIPSTSRNWQTRSLDYEEPVFLSI